MRHETELRTPTIDKHTFTLCIIRPLLTVTIPFDEELTLETTALKLFTVANLHYFFTTNTQNSLETDPLNSLLSNFSSIFTVQFFHIDNIYTCRECKPEVLQQQQNLYSLYS